MFGHFSTLGNKGLKNILLVSSLIMVFFFSEKLMTHLFFPKLESVPYDACLAITDAIKVTSKEIFYLKLGLWSFQYTHLHKKLCAYLKIYIHFIFSALSPKELLPRVLDTTSKFNFLTSNKTLLKTPFFPASYIWMETNES